MGRKSEPANNRGAGYTVVSELIAAFPDAPAKTLARKAYAENPEVWSSLDACYSAVRRQLGVHGEHNRKNTPEHIGREPRKAGWSDVIPEAVAQHIDWRAVEIPGPQRALILSDVHIPFHSEEALEVALEYGADRDPTIIILNGDIADHFALSRWETDPRERDFPGEVEAVRFFLSGLRTRFPDIRIVYKKGNHSERLERYLMFKAPELLGVKQFEWASIFGLDEYRVELVDDKRPIRLGELNLIHGHEYTFSISNPVNPARGFFLRSKTHVLGGHMHQTSQHSEKSLEQKVISAWSTGCLCDLHPRYRPINNWNHGFAFVETDDAGAFHVDNLRIVGGKAW